MQSTDIYIGVLLAAMFVVGIVLIVRWRRQRSKTREQWGNTLPR
jgi:hypothetical protein